MVDSILRWPSFVIRVQENEAIGVAVDGNHRSEGTGSRGQILGRLRLGSALA